MNHKMYKIKKNEFAGQAAPEASQKTRPVTGPAGGGGTCRRAGHEPRRSERRKLKNKKKCPVVPERRNIQNMLGYG